MSEWTLHEWVTQREKTLVVEDLFPEVRQHERDQVPPARLGDMVSYAEQSYLACRVLMLSSRTLHPSALYMAVQTVEKYLKALLLARSDDWKVRHGLERAAHDVGGKYADAEFLRLCKILQEFDIAGRYADHRLQYWAYTLDLLGFLDSFVLQCREELRGAAGLPNVVAMFMYEDTSNNQTMRCIRETIRDNNSALSRLVAGWSSGGTTSAS